ncbi:hypothetical protein HPO96_10340 [Kribbella sandramycini]|uniref:Uncharacterized protein n=1 Tax=Kribbella sandramycini TaxID=60450 RepID=A0A7Y4KXT6_9ACTN|nr:hypothetical protein [Kribbella sandramycini]MBB6569523.1 hypothetical protein [Kribbella sandramycini]NOL40643.1 hypothetical protein [Kribbella sandramycini]
MTGTSEALDVVQVIADLAPIWLPGCVVDTTEQTVEVGWGRGALQMSAVVGVGEIVDRCLQLPQARWAEQIEAWLRAVVAEGELATEEHRYGDVGERQRALLVQRGWSARTAGPVADALLPFGDHFEVVVFVRTGAELRRLTVVRRSMLGLGDPAAPSPVRLTLDDIADLEAIPYQGFSILRRDGDPLVSMAIVDREKLLPQASRGAGVLVGVPRLSTIAYCPADAGQQRADALAQWIAECYRDAPDQCSPDLYWLQGDHLVQVPVTLASPPSAVLPPALKPQPRRTWLRHLFGRANRW